MGSRFVDAGVRGGRRWGSFATLLRFVSCPRVFVDLNLPFYFFFPLRSRGKAERLGVTRNWTENCTGLPLPKRPRTRRRRACLASMIFHDRAQGKALIVPLVWLKPSWAQISACLLCLTSGHWTVYTPRCLPRRAIQTPRDRIRRARLSFFSSLLFFLSNAFFYRTY